MWTWVLRVCVSEWVSVCEYWHKCVSVCLCVCTGVFMNVCEAVCVCEYMWVCDCVWRGLYVLGVVRKEDFLFPSAVSRFCLTPSSLKPYVNLRQLRLRPSITVKSHFEAIQMVFPLFWEICTVLEIITAFCDHPLLCKMASTNSFFLFCTLQGWRGRGRQSGGQPAACWALCYLLPSQYFINSWEEPGTISTVLSLWENVSKAVEEPAQHHSGTWA